jgi:hypothetical protein
MLLALSPAV